MAMTSVASLHPGASSCDILVDFVRPQLLEVDAVILKHLQHRVPMIPQLAGHLLSAGGKRIRPLLALASTKLCQGDFDRIIPLAASIEFIHTATLLHDDVVDESSVRRGKPSANALWGNSASILVGDFLFGCSFELMVADEDLHVLKILSRVSTIIIEGEVLQLSASYDFEQAKESYFEIISSKTGQLFSAACEVGAAVSDVSLEHQKAMADYGMYIGMAFQCIDDLLDYYAEESTMGKKPGDDFREGKITLPVLLAYEQATMEEKAFWHDSFKSDDQTDETFEKVRQKLISHDVYSKVTEIANSYVTKAQNCLNLFPDSEIKQALHNFAEFCVSRAY